MHSASNISPASRPLGDPSLPLRPRYAIALLLLLWAAIFLPALAYPPLLDDADATHAQAAQAMLHTGDWVTLHVNGIRYLEKPPLPYWLAALSMKVFGENAFAVHLPLALAVLGLAFLGYVWGRRAFGERAGFYAALFTLTSTGTFLFTRIFIPEALLSLLLCFALYLFLRALDPANANPRGSAYLMWIALAAAVLTKGLIAPVFFFAATALFLSFTGDWRLWRRLHPFSGLLIFLALAAPWHSLAGLRNTGGANGHGFFWFYFVNEHVLRFLGRRIPRDYNKLPTLLYWSLHLVWLFPWSLFAPAAIFSAWPRWQQRRSAYHRAIQAGQVPDPHLGPPYGTTYTLVWLWKRWLTAVRAATDTVAARTILLLLLFAGTVLVFFSLSSNQEYYTFPVYLPLLLLLAAALPHAEASQVHLAAISSTHTPLLL